MPTTSSALLNRTSCTFVSRANKISITTTAHVSDFADTVTTLQSHVNSFREQYDDGYLPPHLRIHGLATSINQNTQARMRDVISPRVRRLSAIVQGIPTVHRVDRDDRQRVGFKDRDGGGKVDREYRPRGRPDTPRTPRD
jgi:hypothetical protein